MHAGRFTFVSSDLLDSDSAPARVYRIPHGFTSASQWIWTENYAGDVIDRTIYCRKLLLSAPELAPGLLIDLWNLFTNVFLFHSLLQMFNMVLSITTFLWYDSV